MKRFFKFILGLALTAVMYAQCPITIAPVITSPSAFAFTEAVSSTFTVTATGTPAPTYFELGALPAGVTFVSNHLAGTPALGTAGTYPLLITAQNGTAPDAHQNFTLTVFAAPVGGFWVPPTFTSWTWWLSNVPPAGNLPAQSIIDSDGVDTPASTVAAMHAAGKRWVCYVDVGTWEPGRPDSAQFPASVKGRSVSGFASEKWLDVRQTGILLPLMSARFQNCKNKGADALELDNIDGYTNNPGFPFTRADQIVYNKAIADLGHSFGLSVAMKNDGDDAVALQPYFDFAIVEQCLQFNECNLYTPFVTAGKSVLNAEYRGSSTTGCPRFDALHMNGIFTNLNLTGQVTSCH